MDTPNDDLNLGPDENTPVENTPVENTPVENTPVENTPSEQPDPDKAYHLPTAEEILNRINNELKQREPMKDEKTPTEPKKVDKKPAQKDEPATPVVVKKDYTLLILSIGVLLVAAAIFVWQNYRKKEDEENTIDLQRQQNDGYEQENVYR